MNSEEYATYLEERKRNGRTSGTPSHRRLTDETRRDPGYGLNPAFRLPPKKRGR